MEPLPTQSRGEPRRADGNSIKTPSLPPWKSRSAEDPLALRRRYLPR